MSVSKHAFGNRTNVDAAKSAGTIDQYDVLFMGDTQEVGWIDKDGNTVISATRTQEDITVAGNKPGYTDGDVIASGTTVQDILKNILQGEVPEDTESIQFLAALPDVGEANVLYVVNDVMYVWDTETSTFVVVAKEATSSSTQFPDALPVTGEANVLYVVDGKLYTWDTETSTFDEVGSGGSVEIVEF